MINFKTITEANFEDVIKLKLDPGSHCAKNVYSLAEAWLFKDSAKPFAIYHDDNLVGFVMFDDDPKEREMGIWRMMFDTKYQNQGLGYKTLRKIIEESKEKKAYDYLYLYCSPLNKRAMHLYKKVGFYETGDVEHGEYILRYDFQ